MLYEAMTSKLEFRLGLNLQIRFRLRARAVLRVVLCGVCRPCAQ